MALDGIFLSLVKKELTMLIGGRIDKIHQPSKEEITLTLRTSGGAFRLLFNISAGACRVHVTRSEIENPKTPPMFCMLMRKRLGGGKLLDIRQEGEERILFFDFLCTNEMGDKETLTLAAEIMGRRSDLIMIDKDGRIIDALKRVGQEMSSVRVILPGALYVTPPREERLSLFNFTREQLYEALNKQSGVLLSKVLLRIFEGISPVYAGEAEHFALRGNDKGAKDLSEDEFDRLVFFLKKTAADIESGKNALTILRTKEGQYKDFCFCDISQYGSLMVKKYCDSACELLDSYYALRDSQARMKQRAGDLFKLIISTSERISRRVANQKQELSECAGRQYYKDCGDLLMANLYQLKKGMDRVSVQNFCEEGAPTVEISLDPRLDPVKNAQKYYAEYRRLDHAQKHLKELIEKGEQELIYIESVFDLLSRATTDAEVLALREELAEEGYVKAPSGKYKQQKAAPPISYLSADGFEVLVGRNNKQNDRLTFKLAEKTDIWLHVKNIPGSHVIIRCGGKEPPESTILFAAQCAVRHSKGRGKGAVGVDYTYVRFVKKIPGAKPGMVTFTHNTTVLVSDEVNDS